MLRKLISIDLGVVAPIEFLFSTYLKLVESVITVARG